MKSWTIFQDIEARYFTLHRQFEKKHITAQQLSAAAQQLRVQDDQGIWWQMRPEDGAWLRWNGISWDAVLPPHLWGPQTLVDFMLSILRDLFKGILWKIPLSFGVASVVWAIHTALIVGPNGGLISGKNALLDMILVLPGSLVTGALFWMVLAGLSVTILRRVSRQGLNQTFQNMTTAPTWVEYSLSGSEGNVLITLLSGCALALLLGVVFGNRLVSFLLVVMSLGALIAQTESLLLRFLRLAWSDGLRLLNRPPRPFNPAWGGLMIIGAVFGFMGAVVLPLMPYTGCAGVFLITGMVILLALLRQGNRIGNAILLLIFIPLVEAANQPQVREITPTNLWVVIIYGILPACGAFCGLYVGLTLGGWDSISPPKSTSAVPASRFVEAGSKSPPIHLPASPLAQPPPPLPSDAPVILKGQPAMDVLVRLGMVRRVITPQGGRYLPVDLDPHEPVSAIAYFQDEQGYLNPTLAIAYSPPASVPDSVELDVDLSKDLLPEDVREELLDLPSPSADAPLSSAVEGSLQQLGASSLGGFEASLEGSLEGDDEAVGRLIKLVDALPVEIEFKNHLQECLEGILSLDHEASADLENIKLQESAQAVVQPKQDRQWADALLYTAKSLLNYASAKSDPEACQNILSCAEVLAQASDRFFSKADLPEKNQQVKATLEAIETALKSLTPADSEPDP